MNEIILTNPNDLRTLIGEIVEEKLTALAKWLESKIINAYNSERLLTPNEAAAFLGKSKSTLNRLRENGTIPVYGLDNGVYYKESDILNALKRLN